MPTIPILSAPTLPSPASVASSLTPSASVATPAFNSQIPQISAPNLALNSISAPAVNIANTSNLSLSSISTGAPTSVSGIASAASINTNMPPAQALQTLGVPTTLSGVGAPINLPSLQLPKIPNFPGLDMAGITLGAGPKFTTNTLVKYKTIVPPFVPGLKINMAMVGAAISIAKAASSGNIGGLLISLTANLINDTRNQAGGVDLQAQTQAQLTQANQASGLSSLEDQYNNIQSQVDETAQEATNAATEQTNTTLTGSPSA